jgi:hypothetical protein
MKKRNPMNRTFDAKLAIEMYLSGKRVQDIAIAFGYRRGTGNSRVRYTLEKVGVFRVRRVRVHKLTGRKFTRLLVIARAGSNKHGFSIWKCVCDCGNERIVGAGELLRGESKSCGCLRTERISKLKFKHGHARSGNASPTYQSWMAMHLRCTNPNSNNWENYGGRGITICERWQGEHGFENFLADLGERPEGHTLDRREVNGNYEPGNCRWATPTEQSNNRRNTQQPFMEEEFDSFTIF